MITSKKTLRIKISSRFLIRFVVSFLLVAFTTTTYLIKRGFDSRDEEHLQLRGGNDDSTNNELIKRAQLHLINIYPKKDLFPGTTKTRNTISSKKYIPYNVNGIFCLLDWNLHKRDPASVPMFRDLISRSHLCKETTVHVDLFTAVTDARAFDYENQSISLDKVHAMQPAGFVFHESRCGSTLVANSLAAFSPNQNRVYSESGPPLDAAKLFDPSHADESIQLLKDVIYMMGRTNVEEEKNLFFKVQSIGTKSLHVFQKAFPQTPWIFVYRNPVQVMMSHLKEEGKTRAVCTRSRHFPTKDLKNLVTKIVGSGNLYDLSTEEFCAAHLATLCEAAIIEAENSGGKGKLVNYDQLPDILGKIIPHHFFNGRKDTATLFPGDAEIRIKKVAEKYSKGRDRGKIWEEDSEEKMRKARKKIVEASAKFLQPSFEMLEKISKNSK